MLNSLDLLRGTTAISSLSSKRDKGIVVLLILVLYFFRLAPETSAGIISASASLDVSATVEALGQVPDSRSDSAIRSGLTATSAASADTFVRPRDGVDYRVPFGISSVPAQQDGFIEAENDFSVGVLNGKTTGSFGFRHIHDHRESHPFAFPNQRHAFIEDSSSRGDYHFTSDTAGALRVNWDARLGQESNNFDNNSLTFELLFDGVTIGTVFTQDGDKSGGEILELPVSAGVQHRLSYRAAATSFIPNDPNVSITGNVAFEFLENEAASPIAPVDPIIPAPLPGGARMFRLDMVVDASSTLGVADLPITVYLSYDPNLEGEATDSAFNDYNEWSPVAYAVQVGPLSESGLPIPSLSNNVVSAVTGTLLIEQDYDNLPTAFYGVVESTDKQPILAYNDFLLFFAEAGLLDYEGLMLTRVPGNRIVDIDGKELTDQEIANLDFEFDGTINLDELPSDATFADEADEAYIAFRTPRPLPGSDLSSFLTFYTEEFSFSALPPYTPLEPTATGGGNYVFENVPGDGRRFREGNDEKIRFGEPTGFLFKTDGNSSFIEVGLPAEFIDADGLFSVCVPGEGCFEVEAGNYFFFSAPVLQFSVLGVESHIQGERSLAFPVFLAFDQAYVNFTMTPIPEPTTSALMIIGLSGVLDRQRRRRTQWL